MANLPSPNQLVVFGRYPKPGATKTRLIPALGPVGAAALQKRLAERIVATARQWVRRSGAGLVFCHDGGDAKQMDRWLGKPSMDYLAQTTGNLGSRMFLAIQTAFQQGAERVLLVGTDIPGITVAILEKALDSLDAHDLVLGPSTDGGYWLVGMTKPKNIFDGIVWGRADVLEKTATLARQKGMDPCLLEPLTDLDTPADLNRELGPENAHSPYLSIIIPALNEERQIARAIVSATSADAEIIVSDGGSRDRTVEMARSLGARIVSGDRGRAGQQNRGARAAKGEVLLFLHADTRLPPNHAAHVFEKLMDQHTILGAFRFSTDIHTPAMRWVSYWTNLRAGRLQLPYGDQGLFMHRADFFSAGGFPDVPIAEDLFLVRTMARQGRIAIAPAAAVTSGRRWQRLGVLQTSIINIIIAIGCLAGLSPDRLMPLYLLRGVCKDE